MSATAEPPSVQILALGMPRTGTMSVKLASEYLGYVPAYHGLDIFQRPQDSVIWNELLKKKHFQQQRLSRTDLDRLFQGYAAVTDMCFLIWEDLLDAYPDVKCSDNLIERIGDTKHDPRPNSSWSNATWNPGTTRSFAR